jgi:hypothetical protein
MLYFSQLNGITAPSMTGLVIKYALTLATDTRSDTLAQLHKPALLAQLDRASDYESEGRWFESSRARQFISLSQSPTKISTRSALDRETRLRSYLQKNHHRIRTKALRKNQQLGTTPHCRNHVLLLMAFYSRKVRPHGPGHSGELAEWLKAAVC